MPRRYRKYRRYNKILKSTKYSNETYGTKITLENDTAGFAIDHVEMIPTVTGNLGTRKVKNFTLRFIADQALRTNATGTTLERSKLAFFLVYVPEGTEPSIPNFGIADNPLSCYEPNQNVILSGMVDSNQVYSYKSRLARNLNSGDTISLILAALTPAPAGTTITTPVTFTLNYAISF